MGRLASAKALTSTNTVLQTTHNKLIDLLDAGYIVEGNVNDHIIRVEVTPSGGFKIFRDDVLVSGIDASGNAIFSGDISAASGTFSGTVSGATINGGTINGTAIYIPNSTSPVFSVNSSGVMSATSGTFSGSVAGGSISIPATSPIFTVASNGDFQCWDALVKGQLDVNGFVYLHPDPNGAGGLYLGDLDMHTSADILADDGGWCGTDTSAWDAVWAWDTSINSPSDRKFKENIAPIDHGVEFILSLNPVQYKLKGRTRTHYGLISQEVKEAMDSAGISDAGVYLDTSINSKDPSAEHYLGLRYGELIAPMVQTIQYLEQRIKDLENKLGSV